MRGGAESEPFAALSAMIDGAVVLLDAEANLISANDEALRLLGDQARLGSTLPSQWIERFALERGERVEEREISFEGERGTVHLRVSARPLAAGGALAYARDVTRGVEREANLRRIMEERGRFMSNLNALTVRADERGVIKAVAAKAPGPWAAPNAQKKGQAIGDLEPPGLARAINERWEAGESEGGVHTFRYRESRDGGAIECEVRLFRVRESRLIHVVDRTEERRIEDQLIVAQHCLDRAIDPIYWIDQDAGIIYANRAARAAYEGELVGRAYSSIAIEFDAEDWHELWRELGDGAGARFESTHRRSDGSSYPVDLGVSLAAEASGAPILCLVARDIAQRVEAEQIARARALSLQRSNESFQEFAYVASHDLQEPLRKIVAFGNRLRRGATELDERNSDYLERMQRAAARMSRLINDLLQFSRVSAKVQPLEDREIGSILEQALDDLEILLEESSALIEVELEPIVIKLDPVQIGQVLMNLVANAIKFAHPDRPPRVRIRGARVMKIVDDDPAVFAYEIAVEDNGIGFEARYAEQIFGAFQRLHGRTSGYQGTGIGLAICRKIVERHRGSIRAESSPGIGSTFYVTLPIEQSAAGLFRT